MIENQRRRVLNEQMMFLKQIPSPEFSILSKNKLRNVCESLQLH